MNSTPFWKKPWVIGLVIILVIALVGISSYNGFVTKSAAVDTQWAQVETQYQRRFDLIPNLVESVKGLMNQEQEIFTALAAARAQYTGATTPETRAAAATQTEGALGRLLAVVENYPELRSSETVQTLMEQLEGTENRISVERSRYNESVQEYNLAVRRFPSSLLAGIFGFDERPLFDAAEGSDIAPKVSL